MIHVARYDTRYCLLMIHVTRYDTRYCLVTPNVGHKTEKNTFCASDTMDKNTYGTNLKELSVITDDCKYKKTV